MDAIYNLNPGNYIVSPLACLGHRWPVVRPVRSRYRTVVWSPVVQKICEKLVTGLLGWHQCKSYCVVLHCSDCTRIQAVPLSCLPQSGYLVSRTGMDSKCSAYQSTTCTCGVLLLCRSSPFFSIRGRVTRRFKFLTRSVWISQIVILNIWG